MHAGGRRTLSLNITRFCSLYAPVRLIGVFPGRTFGSGYSATRKLFPAGGQVCQSLRHVYLRMRIIPCSLPDSRNDEA